MSTITFIVNLIRITYNYKDTIVYAGQHCLILYTKFVFDTTNWVICIQISDMYWKCYKTTYNNIDSFAQLNPKWYQTDHFSFYLVTLLIETISNKGVHST